MGRLGSQAGIDQLGRLVFLIAKTQLQKLVSLLVKKQLGRLVSQGYGDSIGTLVVEVGVSWWKLRSLLLQSFLTRGIAPYYEGSSPLPAVSSHFFSSCSILQLLFVGGAVSLCLTVTLLLSSSFLLFSAGCSSFVCSPILHLMPQPSPT